MHQLLRTHAQHVIQASLQAVLPDRAVERALRGRSFPGRLLLVAVGKAAWQMARAARDCLGERVEGGIVITK